MTAAGLIPWPVVFLAVVALIVVADVVWFLTGRRP